jgi:hypothetical protein
MPRSSPLMHFKWVQINCFISLEEPKDWKLTEISDNGTKNVRKSEHYLNIVPFSPTWISLRYCKNMVTYQYWK